MHRATPNPLTGNPLLVIAWAFVVAVAIAPDAVRAELRLLEADLRAPSLEGAHQQEPGGGGDATSPAEPASVAPLAAVLAADTEKRLDLSVPVEREQPSSLDFDLLGAPRAAPDVDERALRVRRTMLNLHQGFGFGLLGLQLGATVLGQLNYSDRFYGPSTGKYQTAHAVFAYSTLAAFGATALVGLLAPNPLKQNREGFDRVTFHKIAMFTAKAGMLTQGILGVVAHDREGHLNQKGIATAHLVIGYATLAAITAGVGAIAF